jgi:hypothetical protein
MRRDYDDRIASKGRGRKFHSLAGDGEEVEYVKDLLHWANTSLVDGGSEPLKGHSKEWLDTYHEQRERRKLLRFAKNAKPEGLWARAGDLEKA